VTDADRVPFAALLSQALGFYRQDVSEFALGVWWSACQPFALEQVRKALTAHAMDAEHGRFAPKPADLVRVLAGTHTDRALLAWSAAHTAMSSVGAYASVDFGDAATHAAIADIGGWPSMCRSTLDELPHLQRRFCEAYRAYSRRAGEFEAPRYLAGEHEVHNRALGFEVKPPVVVGGVWQVDERPRITHRSAPALEAAR
jgi:Domain of unknown function (DUF6475)